jgi:RimJ/RimL family protein N-acetyltransferase
LVKNRPNAKPQNVRSQLKENTTMEIFAETERLILRELLPTDRNGLFAVDSDPDVNIYLGNNPVKTIEQTDDIIKFIRKQYVDNGIGRWAMIEKSTNNFIGWAGLKLIKELTNNRIDYYDLGYRLNKSYWGKGFATEAAKATLKYGFNTLNLNEIYAIADSKNIASRNVIEKVGLKYKETFIYCDTDHDWFEIQKLQ